jgi:hypothetical protein
MTRRSIRASAVVLGCGVLVAIAGCGGGSATTTQSASAQGTQNPGRAGGPFTADRLSALAKELGVSTARLQQALAGARPAGAPNGAPPGGGQGSGRPRGGAGGRAGQLAANLAKQLNLPTAKVQQALAKVFPGRPQGGAPPAAGSTSGSS